MKTFLYGSRSTFVRIAIVFSIFSAATPLKNTCLAQVQQLVDPPKESSPQSSSSDRKIRSKVDSNAKPPRTLLSALDNPESHELLDQLQSHETAAAADAVAIRQLDHHGESKPGEPTIEQRKANLTRHLDSAFDLKLKLEDLQIKQLQSRLSQLERQTAERKLLRDQIVKRRAAELTDGDALQWQPWSTNFEAAKATGGARRSHDESEQIIDSVRENLRPFLERVNACQDRVRELEPDYFHDQSNVVELQAAMDALSVARRTVNKELKPHQSEFDRIIHRLQRDVDNADELRVAADHHHNTKFDKVGAGEATESDLKVAIAAANRASDDYQNLKGRLDNIRAAVESVLKYSANDWEHFAKFKFPKRGSQADVDEFTIQYWFETVLKLKVDFMRIDGLDVPFKAALQIRAINDDYHPSDESNLYEVGDLIVGICGKKFETLKQLTDCLNEFRPWMNNQNFDHDPRITQGYQITALRGGLAGSLVEITEGYLKFDTGWNDLIQPDPQKLIWGFEIVKSGQVDVPEEKQFINGVCVSIDGLVAVSFSAEEMNDRESIVLPSPPAKFQARNPGVARVVATDADHGIRLVKIEGVGHDLFPWIKCRSTVAKPGRPLHIFGSKPGTGVSPSGFKAILFAANEVAAKSEPDNSHFFVKLSEDDLTNVSPSLKLTVGSAVTTFDDSELEGILLESGADSKQLRKCIAANVIDRMVKEYHRHEQETARNASQMTTQTVGRTNSTKLEITDSTPEAIVASARENLTPAMERVMACQDRIRALEPVYFQDRSNVVELQNAWKELSEARRTFRQNLEPYQVEFHRIMVRLQRDVSAAHETLGFMKAQWETKAKKVADGEATDADLKVAIAASQRLSDDVGIAEKKLENFRADVTSVEKFGAHDLEELDRFQIPKPRFKGDVDEFTIQYWFETVFKLKVDFVQFDGIDLPFKAAVRIREREKESGWYQAGDLIVVLGGHKFETINQLAEALNAFQNSYLNSSPAFTNVVLRGGLTGSVKSTLETGQIYSSWGDICESGPQNTIWGFDFLTRSEPGAATRKEQASGVCVALDGLAAVFLLVEKLVDRGQIVVTKSPRGFTIPPDGHAKVVAVDPIHGIALVKLEAFEQRKLFPWIKCRSGLPKPGRSLHLFESVRNKSGSQEHLVTVVTADEAEDAAQPDNAHFFIRLDENETKPSTAKLVVGSPLTTSFDVSELDGVIQQSEPDSNGVRICLAANVINRLLKEYRDRQREEANVQPRNASAQSGLPDNDIRTDSRPNQHSTTALSPEVIQAKRELLPKFLLSGSMVSQESYDAGITQAVDLVSRDRELLRVVVLEIKAGMDANPRRASVRRLLDVLPQACSNYGLNRWKREQQLQSKIMKVARNRADDPNDELKAQDEAALSEIIALGYRADRQTIDHLTCAVRNLHHFDGKGFLRDVLREDPTGAADPFQDTPALSPSSQGNGPTKKAGRLWEDNMGGGWDDAKCFAALGLAELGDTEGVLWLLGRAKPNPFDIDRSLSFYRHLQSKTGSQSESCRLSLVDLFDLKPNATVEELLTWWDTNKNVFQPRAAQIGTRKN